MTALMRYPAAVEHDPRVEAWLDGSDPLRQLARAWFESMRACGADVREVLADGHPVVCAGDAAFAYVDAFSTHAAVGFYQGASLDDPSGLLKGGGRRMRHVKLRWGESVDEAALGALIETAYRDIQVRRRDEGDAG
ncbi:MAG: DUF1801 domain-containing protein [Caulobacterales bacterium]|nr:DUF1801 domain-containing protein [Caulobacterales bacterium]